ncbi:MAG: hypothetical protein ACR2LK_02725 [Solirubrobacteraceae bacterium]
MRHESVLQARARKQVVDTLPDLVEAIHACPATALLPALRVTG